MTGVLPERTVRLMERGVAMDNPLLVRIGDEVDLENISADGVRFLGQVSISGSETVLSPGVRLGEEGPVTMVNCRLGRAVQLKGGYYRDSVFLDRASFGLGAHVREGCLVEEEAGGAHTVGLKQTILFPYVTLGSLVNFCDCLMAGGTSRKDHSEVGSSYIHFNYTPNQDKATPSLLGDVPRGVMLRERPIFLGGQGGLVGPVRVGFGAVIAAGIILRKDVSDGHLVRYVEDGSPSRLDSVPYRTGFYVDPERILYNNIGFIANLVALGAWYRHVRRPLLVTGIYGRALCDGAEDMLARARAERLRRLGEFVVAMADSGASASEGEGRRCGGQEHRYREQVRPDWPRLKDCLAGADPDTAGDETLRTQFLDAFGQHTVPSGRAYLETIGSLDVAARSAGTAWLASIVDDVVRNALEVARTPKGAP